MLAPVQTDVETDLVEISDVIRSIGGFARSCLSADLAQVSPPLAWVTDAQAILASCRTAAQNWLAAKPGFIPPLTQTFNSYASLIAAGVATLGSTSASDDWTKFLGALRTAAQANSEASRAAMLALASCQTEFTRAHNDLGQAIEEAQAAADAENADILAVEVQVQALMDRLNSLSDGATADTLAAGKSMGQTSVQITYAVVTAVGEVETPYFGMVSVIYTTGSSIYTVVEDDSEIRDILDKISTLMVQLDNDVRVLAMTKALLATLARMNDAYVAASQIAPRLNAYWDSEADKIDIVIEALGNGVAPGLMTELASLATAEAVWTRLAKVATGLATPDVPSDQAVPLKISVAEK